MSDKQCEHCKTWASYTYQGFCKIECAVAKVRELEKWRRFAIDNMSPLAATLTTIRFNQYKALVKKEKKS